MQEVILQEIHALKEAFARLLGLGSVSGADPYSVDALDTAAKEFQKLSIARGEWVEAYAISKIIKNAPYNAGAFIRAEFGFTNFFKKGQTFYYNKNSLAALAKELRDRNVDLKSYMEYREDNDRFQKAIKEAAKNGKGKKKAHRLPPDLYDFATTPPKLPEAEVIRADIARLKEEFFKTNLNEYVDIHKGNYAITKFVYWFDKYLEPGLKSKCKRWCDDFNYANEALKLVTGKKETFVPVKPEDMFEL